MDQVFIIDGKPMTKDRFREWKHTQLLFNGYVDSRTICHSFNINEYDLRRLTQLGLIPHIKIGVRYFYKITELERLWDEWKEAYNIKALKYNTSSHAMPKYSGKHQPPSDGEVYFVFKIKLKNNGRRSATRSVKTNSRRK